MPTTSPDNFPYPDNNSDASINVHIAALAGAVQAKVGPYILSTNVTLTISDNVNFKSYTGTSVPVASREGKLVHFAGILACSTAGYLQSTARRVIGTLPIGFRPKSPLTIICQGSGYSKWMLEILVNGTVSASRVEGTQVANYWMPFSISYTTD